LAWMEKPEAKGVAWFSTPVAQVPHNGQPVVRNVETFVSGDVDEKPGPWFLPIGHYTHQRVKQMHTKLLSDRHWEIIIHSN
jgi:hypothetical protein